MGRRETEQKVVRLRRQTPVSALFHDRRIPRILDALLNRELTEIVDGIGVIAPKHGQCFLGVLGLFISWRNSE